MNKSEKILERSYHIPLSLFDEAFRSFQHRYVYPRNIVLTVILLAVGGVYVHAVVKDSTQTLGYLLIVACVAMILITWYNTFKLRRTLREALKEIENDIYELKVYSEGMTVLAKDSDGSDFQVVEDRPAAEPETPETPEGNGFQPLFPEQEKGALSADGTPLEPTEIEFSDSTVVFREYEAFFMVYPKQMRNFFVIPKKDFSESEQETLRRQFRLK